MTKLKVNLFRFSITGTLFCSLMLFFGNCGQSFEVLGEGQTGDSANAASIDKEIQFDKENNIRLQSYSQIAATFSALTKVPITSDISAELESRSSLLADSPSLLRITAPLFVGTAKLGSVFCQKLISQEKTIASSARRSFASIDFTRPIEAQPNANLLATWQKLASLYWDRELTADEIQIQNDYFQEFLSSVGSNEDRVALTSDYLLGVCTGMLTSFDSITL